jgi:short-subunit dehydrogenase
MHVEQLCGHWALVTGASSGIGAAFCRKLAESGVSLVMVARRQGRMDALAAELKGPHPIETLVVPADLSRRGAARQVHESVQRAGIRIRLLVNNAGFGPWGRFEENPVEVHEAVVQLVAATPIALCHAFRADLASHPSSAIINLSSPAALQPVPYKAVYSGAKTALHNFSLALYKEWRAQGIHVQTLIPGPTRSELDEKGRAYKCRLTDRRDPPEDVVAASLAQLGRNRPVVTTHKGVYKQRLFNGLFPYRVVLWEIERMFRPPQGR